MSRMGCPECGAETYVSDSRSAEQGGAIRRRRLCPAGHRSTTYERFLDPPDLLDQLERALGALDDIRTMADAVRAKGDAMT